MLRSLAVLALACALMLATAPIAEARLFEPQANWRHAGELCVASRKPPARRWRTSPPRACRIVIVPQIAIEQQIDRAAQSG